MDNLAYLIRDVLVWSFENLMEPMGNIPNYTFFALLFVGLFIWLKMQAKFNADAKANPHNLNYTKDNYTGDFQIK